MTHKCNKVVSLLRVGQWTHFTVAWYEGYDEEGYGGEKFVETYKGQYIPESYIYSDELGIKSYIQSKRSYKLEISSKDAEKIKSHSSKLKDMVHKDNNNYYFISLWKYLQPITQFNIRKKRYIY